MELLKKLSNLRKSGSNVRAQCPYCGRDRSFLLNEETGWWICFKCEERGNVKKLMLKLGFSEKLSNLEAEKLQSNRREPISVRLKNKSVRKDDWIILPEYILHSYRNIESIDLLKQLGFTEKVIEENEIGYDRISKRVTFPVRDYKGNLVAVSGRATEDWMRPKYKVYDFSDIVDGYKMENRRHLYLLNKVYPKAFFSDSHDPIIIVEGYKGALWLTQHGYNAVAIQGSSMTNDQAHYLTRLRGEKIIFLDNEPGKQIPDPKGKCAAHSILRKLLYHKNKVKIARYNETKELSPDDLTAEQLSWSIKNASNIPIKTKWRRNAIRKIHKRRA